MTMITPSYLGETIEYSSLHACRSTLEDPNQLPPRRAHRQLRRRPQRRKPVSSRHLRLWPAAPAMAGTLEGSPGLRLRTVPSIEFREGAREMALPPSFSRLLRRE